MAKRKVRKLKKQKSKRWPLLVSGVVGLLLALVVLLWMVLGGAGEIGNTVRDKASLMADRMDELVTTLKSRRGPPGSKTRQPEPKKPVPSKPVPEPRPMEEPLTDQERGRLNELLESSP